MQNRSNRFVESTLILARRIRVSIRESVLPDGIDSLATAPRPNLADRRAVKVNDDRIFVSRERIRRGGFSTFFLCAVSPTLSFNGSQNVLVKMPANTTSQVEHLTVRFKTIRPAGLLFAASHKSGDRIEIGVFGGKIRLFIQINNREKVVMRGR